jgi:hypothetical protein
MIAKVDGATIDGLVEGYQKEVELYRSMLEITQMQSDGLRRDGDVREFVSLLQRKEDIVRSIDKLETGLQPLKRTWQQMPEEARNDSNGKATKLNHLLDTVIVLIEKIIRKERENERILQARRDQLGDDIALIDRGRRMHKAFAVASGPRFMDASR